MEQFDEPITIELRTKREVAVLMFSLGLGSAMLLRDQKLSGAQTGSNLQIRTTKGDAGRVVESLNEYGEGGVMSGGGMFGEGMSTEAAVSRLADEEETDPDEVTRGSL